MRPSVRQAGVARDSLLDLLEALVRDQGRARRTLNLVPSENILSPLARVPFVLDAYSRYFFDHFRKFGSWCFYGALEPGRIEIDVLLPLLRELAGAPHVTVQPLSGLNCMTVALSALTRPGDCVVTVPPTCGGHISTAGVAARLGLRTMTLPMRGLFDIDDRALAALLRTARPALVYIDQSTQLFPIDPMAIRAQIDRESPSTRLHVDSSHVNGLILFGAMWNPLDRGADTFGGSTHKTLPGPHKGFLATRDAQLFRSIEASADVFVSHHHPADVLSLAITLLELKAFDGWSYAARVCSNAKRLAERLHDGGIAVAASDRGFTACHQVWVDPGAGSAEEIAATLAGAGVNVNRLSDIPGHFHAAFRLSVAEITRLGAIDSDIDAVAMVLQRAIVDRTDSETLRRGLDETLPRLNRPRYCFDARDEALVVRAPQLAALAEALSRFTESAGTHQHRWAGKGPSS